ncbi:DUF692 domain-containing protein [Variovorax sp. PCZ-1]|uniref:DUF692 domain-containing protein n=1 Tax=Variovorax sp. PCZ-1 TaxID=2835533 RepID=UPI001BCB2858|nr:DUF692 domain-containing protein [Variovorax sp. PCZ-1]MBS7806079.1 DUF692 domain-containing protein [Variovorax sp. PCZ-1]
MRTHAGIGWRHAHYAAVLEQRPAVGFLQVHSENFFGFGAPAGGAALATLQAAREHYSISLHGVGLSLGSALGIDEWHLDQLASLVQRIEPVRVSDHACFARGHRSDERGGGQMLHAADLLPIPFTHDSLAVLCANVQRVQERLQRPLLVENLSAYVQYAQADFSETQFLSELIKRTGCKLLLDVNNVFVNSLNSQNGLPRDRALALREAFAFLDELPANAVGEMHLAGHCEMEDIVIDDHGSAVCDEVWQLYAHAVRRFGDMPALIEWDTNVPELDVLLAHASKADLIVQEAQT